MNQPAPASADPTPEDIARRLVGPPVNHLLVEAHRLIVEGIREDRRTRAANEGAREVLRGVAARFLGLAEIHRRQAMIAGDRHDADGADEADEQEEICKAAATAVSEALEALPR